jgi:O-antigen ligase
MHASADYPIATVGPGRYLRARAATVPADGPNISFKLLIVYLLMMYSSISVLYPQLNVLRPVLVIAVGAIGMMVVEIAQARESLKLMWPEGYLLLAFLAAALISSFTAMYARLAFDTTADLAKVILIYILIENTVTSESKLRKIFLTLAVAGLFPAIGTILHYHRGIFLEGTRASWVGFFKNPNEDAYALTMLVPIVAAVSFKSRVPVRLALWTVIGIYLVAIFLTFSRGGLLGLVVVLGLIVWRQNSFALKAVMLAALIGGIVFSTGFWNRHQDFNNISKDTTFNQRIATIAAGGLMFIDNPLLGVGPMCSVVAYPLYVPESLKCGCETNLVIHNTPVEALSELGALGFIPFAAFFTFAFVHLRRIRNGPVGAYASALEIALWGFVVCGLSGGFAYSWWPYIVVGLGMAAKRLSDSKAVVA